MIQLLSKKLFFSAALLLTASAFSSDQNGSPQSKEFHNQGQTLCDSQMLSAYNASSRFDVKCPWNIFASGSFLWWLPKEKGLEVGVRYVSDDTNLEHGRGHFFNMDFDYKPGFKALLGVNFNHDQWLLDLEYTRFHCNHSVSVSVNTDTLTLRPIWLTLENAPGVLFLTDLPFNNAHGSWGLNMDLLDLRLLRPFYSGTQLTVTPFVGFRGGWMNQKYNARYIGTTYGTVTSKSSQDSWLIGPRAGLQSNWLIGCGFRIFGDVNASLFYQRFDNDYLEHTTFSPSHVWIKISETSNLLTPNLEMLVGLGYGTYFSCNRWHFDLLAGYNFQIFWNQNLIRNLKDRVGNGFSDGNFSSLQDLILHGLTVTARLDF